jgi:hypothetical protein
MRGKSPGDGDGGIGSRTATAARAAVSPSRPSIEVETEQLDGLERDLLAEEAEEDGGAEKEDALRLIRSAARF